jgi:hypothetical protein
VKPKHLPRVLEAPLHHAVAERVLRLAAERGLSLEEAAQLVLAALEAP